MIRHYNVNKLPLNVGIWFLIGTVKEAYKERGGSGVRSGVTLKFDSMEKSSRQKRFALQAHYSFSFSFNF